MLISEITEVKMLWTCSLGREDKKCTKNFGRKSLGKQLLKRPRIDEKIILSLISGN
jgi:hypothetical protein